MKSKTSLIKEYNFLRIQFEDAAIKGLDCIPKGVAIGNRMKVLWSSFSEDERKLADKLARRQNEF